jgi:hypothetical protein
MNSLLKVIQDKAQHVTAQEYSKALNTLHQLYADTREQEDPYFLLFLYVEKSTHMCENPEYNHLEFCRKLSWILDRVPVEHNRKVKTALVICAFQYVFKNTNVFVHLPAFRGIVLAKLEYFIERDADEFIQLNRLDQLHGWRAELTQRDQ